MLLCLQQQSPGFLTALELGPISRVPRGQTPVWKEHIKPAGIHANHADYNLLYLEVALIKSADTKPV